MIYLHLIWAALFRRKSRTFLTLVSIFASFWLFGMLDATCAAFLAGARVAVLARLTTS